MLVFLAAVPAVPILASFAELVSSFWMGQAALASSATGKDMVAYCPA